MIIGKVYCNKRNGILKRKQPQQGRKEAMEIYPSALRRMSSCSGLFPSISTWDGARHRGFA
jgi:hypothetical protein